MWVGQLNVGDRYVALVVLGWYYMVNVEYFAWNLVKILLMN